MRFEIRDLRFEIRNAPPVMVVMRRGFYAFSAMKREVLEIFVCFESTIGDLFAEIVLNFEGCRDKKVACCIGVY